MRIFFYKLLLFLVVVAMVAFGSYFINEWSISKERFKLQDSTETLITGSSLVTLGIDPDYISKSENIALEAEPLVTSYFKLCDVLDTDTHIKRVIISFSLQEVVNQDRVFNASKSVVDEMFTRLMFLTKPMTLKELSLFQVNRLSFFEAYVRFRIFPNYFYLSRLLFNDRYDKLLHIGGFQKMSVFNKKRKDNSKVNPQRFVKKRFPDRNMQSHLSRINIGYIDSIGSLCSNLGIELIAVGMPISQELYRYIPSYYIDYYNSCTEELTEKGICRVINFTKTGEPDWFSDLVHLNEYGAKILSIQLNDLIKN